MNSYTSDTETKFNSNIDILLDWNREATLSFMRSMSTFVLGDCQILDYLKYIFPNSDNVWINLVQTEEHLRLTKLLRYTKAYKNRNPFYFCKYSEKLPEDWELSIVLKTSIFYPDMMETFMVLCRGYSPKLIFGEIQNNWFNMTVKEVIDTVESNKLIKRR